MNRRQLVTPVLAVIATALVACGSIQGSSGAAPRPIGTGDTSQSINYQSYLTEWDQQFGVGGGPASVNDAIQPGSGEGYYTDGVHLTQFDANDASGASAPRGELGGDSAGNPSTAPALVP